MTNTSIEHLISSLREARKRASLTQKDLGAMLGKPQSYISEIEGGRRDLRITTLVEIARELELEVMLVPKVHLRAILNIVAEEATDDQAAYQLVDYDEDESNHEQ